MLTLTRKADGVSDGSIYATPQAPASISDCMFYHTMEIPGHGRVTGEWDLQANIKKYLGEVDLQGKRVLDVGAASGYLTFEMEKQGAQVVSYDLSSKFKFESAPSRYGYRRHTEEYRAYIEAIRRGYWLTHKALNSRAKMVFGTVYEIPKAIGPVDVSVFGSILLHLRDPILALQNALRLTTEKVVVVEPLWETSNAHAGPQMTFVPEYWKDEPQATWWHLTPAVVQRFLAALGFEKSVVSYHEQLYHGIPWHDFTVVAERTQPREDFGMDH